MKHVGKLKDVTTAMNLPAPTMGAIWRERGEEFSKAYVALWLIYINEVLDLNRPMNEHQIELCTQNILNEFSYLKVTDLTLLTNRIITGEYGEFYERISITKVLSIFREYTNERFELAENESYSKHIEFKQNQDNFNVTGNVRRIIEKGAKGFNQKK